MEMIMIKRFIALIFTFLVLGFSPSLANEGFIIETLKEGKGDFATANQQISVHYEGKLIDGTVFDASRLHGQPFSFTLGKGQVIKGWDEGMLTMKLGEKAILKCSADYAYGESGFPAWGILPNSPLNFEIEVLSIK